MASELMSQNPRLALVFFYLPGMAAEADPWARALYGESLGIEIDIGLSQEDEKQLLGMVQNQKPNIDVIGRWFHHGILDSRMTTIFKREGKMYLEETYTFGYNRVIETVERSSPLGRRFNKVEGSSAGDHWIIDSTGNLQLRDDYGLIEIGLKVDSSNDTTELRETTTEEAEIFELLEWFDKQRELASEASAYATPVPTISPAQ